MESPISITSNFSIVQMPGGTVPPPALSKYCSASSACSIIHNATLKWTHPQDFDDPNDTRLSYTFGFDLDQLARIITRRLHALVASPATSTLPQDSPFRSILSLPPEKQWDFLIIAERRCKTEIAEFKQYIHSINQSYYERAVRHTRVLCLSEEPLNFYMWSKYGDGHRGCVLRFDQTKSLPWNLAARVTYKESLHLGLDPDGWADVALGQRQLPPVEQAIFDMFCSKLNTWKHEREWRIVGVTKNDNLDPEMVPFNIRDLSEIYFGARCPSDDRSRVIEACTDVGIRPMVYECEVHPASNAVTRSPCLI